MQENNVSLTDLGFRFYYDDQHKYEVMEGDKLDVSPNKSLRMYFGMRPYQKDDGKWYTKEVTPVGPIPYIFAGMYEKQEAKDSVYIGSKSPSENTGFSVSEFSIWNDYKENVFLESLFNDRKSMISATDGVYASVSSAENDKLHVHLEFSNTLMLARNFNNNEIIASKSTFLQLESDEIHNGNSLSRVGTNIKIDNVLRSEKFTLAIRFMLHDMTDRILYESAFVKIVFSASNREIVVSANTGSEVLKLITEVPEISAMRWEHFSMSFDGRFIKTVFSGKFKESFIARASISDYRYLLNMTNISSFTGTQRVNTKVCSTAPVSSGNSAPTVLDINGILNITDLSYPGARALVSAKPFIVGEITNLYEMLRDQENEMNVFAIKTTVEAIEDLVENTETIKLKQHYITARRYRSYYGSDKVYGDCNPTSEIKKYKNTGEISYEMKLHSTNTSIYQGSHSCSYESAQSKTTIEQRILGSIGKSLYFDIIYSNTLQENVQTFPMVWLFPGTQLVVTEIELTPPT